jgi:molybdopterin converting factor small subunit
VFDAAAQSKPSINILKNGRNSTSLQHLRTVIADGGGIALFPPVAGG